MANPRLAKQQAAELLTTMTKYNETASMLLTKIQGNMERGNVSRESFLVLGNNLQNYVDENAALLNKAIEEMEHVYIGPLVKNARVGGKTRYNMRTKRTTRRTGQ